MADTGTISYLVTATGAIGGLGTAAFGLVDATKSLGGGVSNVGYKDLARVLDRFFASALDRALGAKEWRAVVYAHWINGKPKDEQKAVVKALIRLGLAPETAADLAKAGHVDPDALKRVATKLAVGEPLVEADLNVLGRFDASVEAHLDGAFDRADQRYRSTSRVLAGIFAIVLALTANWALEWNDSKLAFLVGILAVPLAPIAKDLASSLSAAAHAMKAAKNQP